MNSTIGYCQLILVLQFAHFPCSRKKEIRGILCFQEIVLLHLGQTDLPERGEVP